MAELHTGPTGTAEAAVCPHSCSAWNKWWLVAGVLTLTNCYILQFGLCDHSSTYPLFDWFYCLDMMFGQQQRFSRQLIIAERYMIGKMQII